MVATNTIESALETALVELLNAVILQIEKTRKFKTLLKRLEKTLETIEPIFHVSVRLGNLLDRPEKEIKIFLYYIENGINLVLKCSRIKCWNVYKKFLHANKLIRLDKKLLMVFQLDLHYNVSTSMRGLMEIYSLGEKMDQVLSIVTKRAGGFSGSCSVPGLPDVIIGLDFHLQELKRMLLEDDDNQVLTVSAPGGCGKTTLAKMICHDNKIKGIFGENIFYVTVSRTASLRIIVQKLFAHHLNVHRHEFQSDEDAKNQLENVMRQMGSDRILLVLDDVWSDSESLIQDLKFPIPVFKILITSRFVLSRYGSTYELSLLNDEDGRTLLCYSAFPTDGIPFNVPDDLVSKMVKCCKGFPLALTVIGASLCGQGVLKWKTTLKKWSEGQSIFDTNSRLLLSLQASVDALEDLPIARDCFLDLGAFPEDEKISASALMDIWVESYDLDEEGMYTSEYLLELSSRNLLSLVLARKDASELEGYCNEHYVTQHDLLRELAIHMSSQEPIAQRKRLLLEIKRNDIPIWWIEQTQPIATHLLSITTDETFSSSWYDLDAPKVEVLILNIRSQKYVLPHFMKKMNRLKALNITSYGIYPSELLALSLIASLSNLRRMKFEHVSLSPLIQSIFELKNLQKLSFIMCEIGDSLDSYRTHTPALLPNLKELEFDRCYDLKELPAGISSLEHLKKLSITNCHELEFLPKRLGSLSNLEILILHSCTRLAKLPNSIGNLHNLIFLDISDCLSISSLPDQIGKLNGLRVLKMSGCRGLEEIPASAINLSLLEDVICDEETSYLWSYHKNVLCELKINVVEDDSLADFMKIVAP